jgi:hypothetical protein
MWLDVYVTAHRDKFLIIKPTRCINFSNLLASCQQTCMTYTIAVCTVKNSWWWTEELSKICGVSFQNKFEKLVHLVGFIIRYIFIIDCNEVWFLCTAYRQFLYITYWHLFSCNNVYGVFWLQYIKYKHLRNEIALPLLTCSIHPLYYLWVFESYPSIYSDAYFCVLAVSLFCWSWYKSVDVALIWWLTC